MSKDNFDAETKAQLGRSDALRAMFESSGWKYAEEDLMELIAELKDISTIDLEIDTVQQIRDRKNLAEGLLEWLESLHSQVNNGIILRDTEKKPEIIERR